MFPNIKKFDYVCLNAKIKKEDIADLVLSGRSNPLTIQLISQEADHLTGTFDITSDALKKYISEIPKYKDFLNCKDPCRTENRKKIIDFSCEFLRFKKGNNPQLHHKIALINALQVLFPAFKNQKESVMLKYLREKLKNTRRAISKIKKTCSSTSTSVIEKEDNTVMSIAAKVEFLKHADVFADADKIKKFLKDTLDYRLKEMKNNEFHIKSAYKFFVVRPEFVSYF